MHANKSWAMAASPSTGDGSLANSYQDNVVDSGTIPLFLPSEIVTRFAEAFQPPTTLDRGFGVYFVPCQATFPLAGIKTSEMMFWHIDRDMVGPYDHAGPTYYIPQESRIMPDLAGFAM